MDIESMGADHAAVFERTTSAALKDPLGAPAAAEWPEELPGLWKGEARVDEPGVIAENATISPAYLSITKGAAPNAWIFLDPTDETKIINADVNLLASVEMDEAATSVPSFNFTNKPWKYTEGLSSGTSNWCNVLVLNDAADASLVLSADAPAGEEARCPVVGDSFQSDALLRDSELMETTGAVAALVMKKQ